MSAGRIIVFIASYSFACCCLAVEQIEVSALLGSKAVVKVDGVQHMLAVGQKTPQGVKLIAVENEGVQLKIDGKIKYYPLGSIQIATQFSKPKQTQERVYKDGSGMFRTAGSINGVTVSFLVDTGASSVAMNSNIAKRVGINYLLSGQPMMVQTAQGVSKAWQVKLDRVRVGQIELSNVTAGVLEGDYPIDVLLGMSFLGKLNVQHQGEVMLLETKF